jgi:hypothetical protein
LLLLCGLLLARTWLLRRHVLPFQPCCLGMQIGGMRRQSLDGSIVRYGTRQPKRSLSPAT